MSTVHETIAIVPPEHLVLGNLFETFYSNPIDCPYCQGKGLFATEETRDCCREETCPICKGKGKIMARITIEWRGI